MALMLRALVHDKNVIDRADQFSMNTFSQRSTVARKTHNQTGHQKCNISPLLDEIDDG